MVKTIAFILMILFQFNCAKPSSIENNSFNSAKPSSVEDNSFSNAKPLTQDNLKEPIAVNPVVTKIKEILQDGWDVSESGSTVFIVRRNPVTLYSGIALPVFGDLRNEMIEKSKIAIEYKITLEFGERLSNKKYSELEKINGKTEAELEKLEDRMSSFRGKGDYNPKTPEDEVLYQKYKQALHSLPYNKLPDLDDNQSSIYIETTRPIWGAFYYPYEENDCKAVLRNIYSLAKQYKEKNLDYSGFSSESEYRVATTFWGGRKYDRHLQKKEMNLR